MSTPHATRPETITVTVRTPAGTPHSFEVRGNERVDKVVRAAVRYFVQAGQLAAGEYGLALIRDGRAEDLADAARLEDYGVVEGDVLVLITKAPQVDG
jgi:Fe2+ transport system protein FeoA